MKFIFKGHSTNFIDLDENGVALVLNHGYINLDNPSSMDRLAVLRLENDHVMLDYYGEASNASNRERLDSFVLENDSTVRIANARVHVILNYSNQNILKGGAFEVEEKTTNQPIETNASDENIDETTQFPEDDDETLLATDDEKTVLMDDEKTAFVNDEKTVLIDYEKTAFVDEEKTVLIDDEKTAFADDETQMVVENDSPDDETQLVDDNETLLLEENVPAGDVTQLAEDVETQMTEDDETQMAEDDETQLADDDQTSLIESTHFADDNQPVSQSQEEKKTKKALQENVHLLKIGDSLKEVSPGEFDYHVIGYVGKGGYGQVYKIEDSGHYKFAMKLLNPEASNYNRHILTSFKQEVLIGRGLFNSGLVKAIEHFYDSTRKLHCCVMEYIEGISLSEVLRYYEARQGKMPVMRAVFVVLRVAEVLDYLSKNHVVHRDIKPQNIMISKDGEVKVLDLGIARKDDNSPLGMGEVPGTLPYIPLGQLRHKDPIDVRVDIYSLGVVFYGLLTGQHPYAIPSVKLPFAQRREELIQELSLNRVPNPRDFNPQVPGPIAMIVMKMMAQDVERRYQTANDLIEDLRLLIGKLQLSKIDEELKLLCKQVMNPAPIKKSIDGIKTKKTNPPKPQTEEVKPNQKEKTQKKDQNVVNPPPPPPPPPSPPNHIGVKIAVACLVVLLLIGIGYLSIKSYLKNQSSFVENEQIYHELLEAKPDIQSELNDSHTQISNLEKQVVDSPKDAIRSWKDIAKKKRTIDDFVTKTQSLKLHASGVSSILQNEEWVVGAYQLWNDECQSQYEDLMKRHNAIYEKLNNHFSTVKRKIDQTSVSISNVISELPYNHLNNPGVKNTLREYTGNVGFVKAWYDQLPQSQQRMFASWLETLNNRTKGSGRWLAWYNSLIGMKNNKISQNGNPKDVIHQMLDLQHEIDSFSYKESFQKVYANVRENLPLDIVKSIIKSKTKDISSNKGALSQFARKLDFKDEQLSEQANQMKVKMDYSRELFDIVKGNKQLSRNDDYSACETNLREMNTLFSHLEDLLQFQVKYFEYRNDVYNWVDSRYLSSDKNQLYQLKLKYDRLKKDYSIVAKTLKMINAWEFNEVKPRLMKMWDELANEADSKVPDEWVSEAAEKSSAESDNTAWTDEKAYLVVNLKDGSYRYEKEEPESWNKVWKREELWLRRIPKGNFLMGAMDYEPGVENDEIPQHEVLITQDFYIGVFECTQKQWKMVMGDNDNPSIVKEDDHPVEHVSINDIRGEMGNRNASENSFIGKLRNLTKTKLYFDLPSEAQWEYACRAGTITSLNSGKNLVATDRYDAELDKLGKYKYQKNGEKSPQHKTVGTYAPNAWGLYDMHGNVQEWCLDYFSKYELNSIPIPDPLITTNNKFGVIRGGGWKSRPEQCRSASRLKTNGTPTIRLNWDDKLYEDTGFRIVCRPPVITEKEQENE